MDHLESLAVADLRTALDEVDGKKPALRLLVAIAYKDGITQGRLADWLGVERKTIYNWLTRIDPDDLTRSVQDEPRPGRPRKLTDEQQDRLARVLQEAPSAEGYDADHWTAPVLQTFVAEAFDVEYSLPSCRRLLAEHDAV